MNSTEMFRLLKDQLEKQQFDLDDRQRKIDVEKSELRNLLRAMEQFTHANLNEEILLRLED